MVEGTAGWRNWRTHVDHREQASQVREAMLYTDTHITGHLPDLGPYGFLNTIGATGQSLAPGIVLRARLYEEDVPADPIEEIKTDAGSYHGGTIFDEMAALVALGLGMRCRVGGLTRIFGDDDLPFGTPVEYEHVRPYLPAGRLGQVIPSLVHPADLTDARNLLTTFEGLTAPKATALVRAARLYQEAVWIANSDPSGSWVALVSALEVGAAFDVQEELAPVRMLRESWPELSDLLEEQGLDFADRVAVVLADLVRARWKFMRFVTKYLPEPPASRPAEHVQADWSRMKKSLGTIYTYRSEALHGGTPFPAPMCLPPHRLNDGPHPETPLGLATRTADATWMREDMPMLLATFEYIARGTLLNWWSGDRPIDYDVDDDTRAGR